MPVSCTDWDDTTLNSLAREKGFAVQDVPRGGTVTKPSTEDVRSMSFDKFQSLLPVTSSNTVPQEQCSLHNSDPSSGSRTSVNPLLI